MVAVGEKYRHYKSTGGDDHTYEIVSIGFFQGKDAYEDDIVVVYKPLYPLEGFSPEVTVVVRPLKEFEGEQEREGKIYKRFTLIS